MQRKTLGCLTPAGLTGMFVTLVVVVTLGILRGGMLFSPGDLSTKSRPGVILSGVQSHADLAGKCSACHPSPLSSDTMDVLCTNCHTQIGQQIAQGSGSLHGALYADSNGELTCRACHTEHQGANAPLTVMDPRNFPHEAVGFSLAAHTQMPDGPAFTCADCHSQDITVFDVASCTSCHQDLDAVFIQGHTADFGQDCIACHDGVETYGKNFDHNALAFPLDGQHAQITCASCHENPRQMADFQGLDTACASCHLQDDAHNGEFGTECGVCHTPVAWEQVTFDHNLTNFPLEGKHTNLECASCHQGNTFKGLDTACASCHLQDDAHNGEFGTECGACHTPVAWDQATFDHSKSGFPLDGAHASVDCKQCHTNGYKGTPSQCESCHQEPVYHAGLFGSDCVACHTTQAWSPAQYNERHTFPINHGESGWNSCRTCHPDSLQTYTCYNCHEHSPSEIERKHRKEGITNFQNCVQCHPTGREEEGGGD